MVRMRLFNTVAEKSLLFCSGVVLGIFEMLLWRNNVVSYEHSTMRKDVITYIPSTNYESAYFYSFQGLNVNTINVGNEFEMECNIFFIAKK